MPLHTRKIPKRIVDLSLHIESLIGDISSAMDGIKLSSAQASGMRWPIAAASLHLAEQHTNAARILTLTHDNDGAGVHLRALFELYTRLTYMFSASDGHRLVATLYVDTMRYENRFKTIRKISKDDKTTLPGYEDYDKKFLDIINQRIQEARQARQTYKSKLNELRPKEFLDEKNHLLKPGDLQTKLSLSYMCKILDETGVRNPMFASHLHSYAHIYSSLSEYAHISTVYIASMVQKDESGNLRIGNISEDMNEYESVRSLVSIYLLLVEVFLMTKKEGGSTQSDLSDLRNKYEATIHDFTQYLAN